jgi:hypothetical protein
VALQLRFSFRIRPLIIHKKRGEVECNKFRKADQTEDLELIGGCRSFTDFMIALVRPWPYAKSRKQVPPLEDSTLFLLDLISAADSFR